MLFVAMMNSKIEVDPKMQKGQRDPVYWLDRLASVFRNLHVNVPDGEPHPCQPVVTYVWSVLSQAFDRFQVCFTQFNL